MANIKDFFYYDENYGVTKTTKEADVVKPQIATNFTSRDANDIMDKLNELVTEVNDVVNIYIEKSVFDTQIQTLTADLNNIANDITNITTNYVTNNDLNKALDLYVEQSIYDTEVATLQGDINQTASDIQQVEKNYLKSADAANLYTTQTAFDTEVATLTGDISAINNTISQIGNIYITAQDASKTYVTQSAFDNEVQTIEGDIKNVSDQINQINTVTVDGKQTDIATAISGILSDVDVVQQDVTTTQNDITQLSSVALTANTLTSTSAWTGLETRVGTVEGDVKTIGNQVSTIISADYDSQIANVTQNISVLNTDITTVEDDIVAINNELDLTINVDNFGDTLNSYIQIDAITGNVTFIDQGKTVEVYPTVVVDEIVQDVDQLDTKTADLQKQIDATTGLTDEQKKLIDEAQKAISQAQTDIDQLTTDLDATQTDVAKKLEADDITFDMSGNVITLTIAEPGTSQQVAFEARGVATEGYVQGLGYTTLGVDDFKLDSSYDDIGEVSVELGIRDETGQYKYLQSGYNMASYSWTKDHLSENKERIQTIEDAGYQTQADVETFVGANLRASGTGSTYYDLYWGVTKLLDNVTTFDYVHNQFQTASEVVSQLQTEVKAIKHTDASGGDTYDIQVAGTSLTDGDQLSAQSYVDKSANRITDEVITEVDKRGYVDEKGVKDFVVSEGYLTAKEMQTNLYLYSGLYGDGKMRDILRVYDPISKTYDYAYGHYYPEYDWTNDRFVVVEGDVTAINTLAGNLDVKIQNLENSTLNIVVGEVTGTATAADFSDAILTGNDIEINISPVIHSYLEENVISEISVTYDYIPLDDVPGYTSESPTQYLLKGVPQIVVIDQDTGKIISASENPDMAVVPTLKTYEIEWGKLLQAADYNAEGFARDQAYGAKKDAEDYTDKEIDKLDVDYKSVKKKFYFYYNKYYYLNGFSSLNKQWDFLNEHGIICYGVLNPVNYSDYDFKGQMLTMSGDNGKKFFVSGLINSSITNTGKRAAGDAYVGTISVDNEYGVFIHNETGGMEALEYISAGNITVWYYATQKEVDDAN